MLDMNKIEEICAGVDEHLRRLEAFAGQLRDIKSSLDELRLGQERQYMHELKSLRREFGDITEQLAKRGLPRANEYERELQEVRQLIDSPEWPAAIDPELICITDEMAAVRAGSILDLLVAEHLKGKRFLDYGCGAGHTVAAALSREAAVAVGYDVAPAPGVTTNFEGVRSNAPYDAVLLHDVLDHAVVIDPIQILQQVKSLLAPRGRVYVRNHPWSSRHGGHLYTKKNKAFLHLVFDEIELTRIGGLACDHNVRVVSPLETYRHWFAEAGFRVLSEIPIRDAVEPFFLLPSAVNTRVARHFPNAAAMQAHLEVSMVEYVLEPTDPSNQMI
jgi:2-polyprenyl-3-methyl-5-hydroxy-6-metoxy-1,4-benzoquinol methylase